MAIIVPHGSKNKLCNLPTRIKRMRNAATPFFCRVYIVFASFRKLLLVFGSYG